MKGAQGLVVALFLGILGVALNWIYLQNKTRDVEIISFVGTADDVVLKPGDTLAEDHFVEVQIPKVYARSLLDFVVQWRDLSTIVGTRATRPLEGGELYYRSDYRTASQEPELAEGEKMIWISVDNRRFVPSLVNPGDEINFIVPTNSSSDGPISQTAFEKIGPFRIGSLGNRLGSLNVMKSSRVAQSQERQIGIIVRDEGANYDAKTMRLLAALQRTDARNIAIDWRPQKRDE
jgi:hypothetical protein